MSNETKQERIAQTLERTRQMSSLVGAMAHQWKQPLNILALLIQDIKDAYTFGELDEAYLNNFVNKGMDNVRFISHSIDDFRSFFDPHTEAERFDIKIICEAITAMLSHQYTSHKISLAISGEGFEATLYINSFRQAVMNIMTVVKEHYDRHSLRGHTITLRLDADSRSLRIIENSKSLDASSISKAMDNTADITELGDYAPLRDAVIFLEDSAGAACRAEQIEEGFAFIVTFP